MTQQPQPRTLLLDQPYQVAAFETHDLAVNLIEDRHETLNTRLVELQQEIDRLNRENRKLTRERAAADERLRVQLGVPAHAQLQKVAGGYAAVWRPSQEELAAEAAAGG